MYFLIVLCTNVLYDRPNWTTTYNFTSSTIVNLELYCCKMLGRKTTRPLPICEPNFANLAKGMAIVTLVDVATEATEKLD